MHEFCLTALSNRLRIGVIVLTLTGAALPAFGQPETIVLEPGKPIERGLTGGEAHSYRIPIASGQYLYAIIDQRGIDVGVTLFAPDGRKLLEIDTTSSQLGEEPLWFVSESAGNYRLEVRSRKDSPAGRYEVKIAELRTAVDRDNILVAAGKAMNKADILAAVKSEEALEKAVEICKAGADIFGKLGDQKNRARALETVGRIYQLGYKTGPAIEYNQKALKLYEELGLKEDMVAILVRLGVIYYDSFEYLRAMDYYQKAIILAEAVDSKRSIAVVRNNLGIIQEELGDFDEALKNYEKSMKIADGINDHDVVAYTLNNIGILYQRKGNLARALEYQERNLSLSATLGDEISVARALSNIGNIYSDLGNDRLALEYQANALKAWEKTTDYRGIANTLNSLGDIYAYRGEYAKALDYYNQSIRINDEKEIINPVPIGNIGLHYARQENYGRALEYFQKALDISGGTDSWTIQQMAVIYAAQGNYPKSIEFANRAIEIASPLGLIDVLCQAYATVGWANLSLGKPQVAQQNLNEAISITEELRRQVGGGIGEQTQFFEKRLSPYHLMVELLTAQNLPGEAFEYVERSKSRTLSDVLQNGRVNIAQAMTGRERKDEQRLKNELASLKIQISGEDDQTRIETLRHQLERKRLEFEEFQSRLYSSHPELRIKRAEMKSITLEETEGLLADERSAVVEFVVAEDKTFLFVITKDAAKKVSFKAFSVDVKEEDVAKRVEAYRSKVAAGDSDFQKPSRELYDLLLKPAAAQLAGKTNIIIVPDGPLWNLPFQALVDDNGKYLAEMAAVSYAPSLTTLREMSKKAKGRKPDAGMELVAFGNPIVDGETKQRVQRVFLSEKLDPLPEAERLVKELGKMYGPNRSKVYFGSQAREETAKQESPKYRIVQFATHGILNNVSPMYSHLVLAQNQKDPNEDGLLEAWEMKDLDLKAEMVVLSACDTARGKISNGEGVIGMTWAMFIAGAPTTVASQWRVESSSTTDLMLEFHRQMLTRRVSKAEALRQAELKLLHTPKYKHPSYWGGWVLVGDGN